MEDKRYSFSNVTVRIYEEEFLKDTSATFKITENQFANSKSAFVVHYFKKGYYSDHPKNGAKVNSDSEILTELKELRKSIETLSNCLKAEKTSTIANSKTIIEVQGSIIDLLVEIANELGLEVDILEPKGD